MLFRNLMLKYYNTGDQGGGNGGQQPPAQQQQQPPAQQPPAQQQAPQAPTFTPDQIQWMMNNGMMPGNQQQQQQQSQQPEQSAYDKIKAEEKATRDRQTAEADMRSQVKFELEFDKTITDNAALFGLDATKMRDGTNGLSGSELVAQLRVTAARAFFDKEENHKIILPDDLAYAKAAIIGKADRAVDAQRAWEIVERAIQISAIRQHHADTQSGNKQSGAMPNLSAWVKRAMDRWNRA